MPPELDDFEREMARLEAEAGGDDFEREMARLEAEGGSPSQEPASAAAPSAAKPAAQKPLPPIPVPNSVPSLGEVIRNPFQVKDQSGNFELGALSGYLANFGDEIGDLGAGLGNVVAAKLGEGNPDRPPQFGDEGVNPIREAQETGAGKSGQMVGNVAGAVRDAMMLPAGLARAGMTGAAKALQGGAGLAKGVGAQAASGAAQNVAYGVGERENGHGLDPLSVAWDSIIGALGGSVGELIGRGVSRFRYGKNPPASAPAPTAASASQSTYDLPPMAVGDAYNPRRGNIAPYDDPIRQLEHQEYARSVSGPDIRSPVAPRGQRPAEPSMSLPEPAAPDEMTPVLEVSPRRPRVARDPYAGKPYDDIDLSAPAGTEASPAKPRRDVVITGIEPNVPLASPLRVGDTPDPRRAMLREFDPIKDADALVDEYDAAEAAGILKAPKQARAYTEEELDAILEANLGARPAIPSLEVSGRANVVDRGRAGKLVIGDDPLSDMVDDIAEQYQVSGARTIPAPPPSEATVPARAKPSVRGRQEPVVIEGLPESSTGVEPLQALDLYNPRRHQRPIQVPNDIPQPPEWMRGPVSPEPPRHNVPVEIAAPRAMQEYKIGELEPLRDPAERSRFAGWDPIIEAEAVQRLALDDGIDLSVPPGLRPKPNHAPGPQIKAVPGLDSWDEVIGPVSDQSGQGFTIEGLLDAAALADRGWAGKARALRKLGGMVKGGEGAWSDPRSIVGSSAITNAISRVNPIKPITSYYGADLNQNQTPRELPNTDTLKWAMQSLNASGGTGLPPDEQAKFDSLLMSGNGQQIASEYMRHSMKYPAFQKLIIEKLQQEQE